MEALTHRVATEDDRQLLRRLCRGYRLADRHPEEPEIVEAALEAALGGDPTISILILLLGGEPIGYLALSIGFSIEAGGRDAFVDELYIEEPYRDRGFGTRALEIAQAECERMGICRMNLEVERHNPRAKALYERLGFADNDRYLLHKRLRFRDHER
jgi:ribosomal protein S18 acetylase RimI-like enzyme